MTEEEINWKIVELVAKDSDEPNQEGKELYFKYISLGEVDRDILRAQFPEKRIYFDWYDQKEKQYRPLVEKGLF